MHRGARVYFRVLHFVPVIEGHTCDGILSGGADRSLARLDDFALQAARLQGQFIIVGFEQESVEAAPMFDGTQGVGADAQAHAAAECIAQQRHVTKVRQKTPLCFNIRVAYKVSNKTTLACEFALA